MTDSRGPSRQVLAAAATALALVVGIDLVTNTIDTERFSWDFRYYIQMAEQGLAAPTASPFAYRYLTPLLVRGLSGTLRLSTEMGFTLVAYFGAITQLLGVFLFTRWYTRSVRGAWFAMLATALSLFNVKFQLFDPFRPDHLAYPLVLLQAYLALTGRFAPLLISTIVGCQIREFNAIPMVAYMYASVRAFGGSDAAERRRILTELPIAAMGLAAAIMLPRLLIPVVESFQFADLSRDGLLRAVLSPLVLSRDVNFAYSIVAYVLPVLLLAGPGELRATAAGMLARDRVFLGAYSGLVLVLSFLGGTDFFRFATYLLVPHVILLGSLSNRHPAAYLVGVLVIIFVFNRIWLPFPDSDLSAYLDFYGGHGTRLNVASVLRIVECAVFIAAGWLYRRAFAARDRPSLAGR